MANDDIKKRTSEIQQYVYDLTSSIEEHTVDEYYEGLEHDTMHTDDVVIGFAEATLCIVSLRHAAACLDTITELLSEDDDGKNKSK